MKFKKILSALLSCSIFATALTAGQSFIIETSFAASSCVIDTTEEFQTISGFGGINHPEWIGDLTDAQVQKAFGNGEDELGFSILRVYVNDDSNQWYKSVNVAKKAQELGATVFATPWNPPASMRINGDATLTGGRYQLDDSKFAEYAKHLNDYVKYVEEQGVDLYSISVQNEPDYASEWTYWSTDELTSFIAEYGDDVVSGTNAKLMSPESFQYKKDIYNSILNNSTALNNIDLFGTHFYGTTRSNMDFSALESCGKPIWMTEVYVPNSQTDSADRWPEAIQVSENIHNGLVVGNMSAYVWWYIRRNYGPMKEDGTISKRGYCMAQYSKFVRPGDVRIAVTEQPAENVYVSAYENDSNQLVVVAVNKGSEGYAQQFTVGSGETITNIDRYRTSADENLALTENLEASDSSFWAQLPAESVSTFVIDIEGEGTPVEKEEPPTDENGWYVHDTFEDSNCNWTGRGAASAEVSSSNPFKGNNSLSVSGRTSAWHGTSKELDTSIFEAGTAYSFSIRVRVPEDSTADRISLTLQYNNSEGETKYANIKSENAVPGEYVQLANTSYTLPAGADGMLVYVETPDNTTDFMIDEFIAAPDETVIDDTVSDTQLYGDVNDDKNLNADDVIMLQKWLVRSGTITNLSNADLNADNTINVFDLCILKRKVITDFS
ncbi:MAG: glucuronoarabinoxylan endo-1,4-beta-xylanase [Ruminococcus sp.]|nr:glucuronoarabinoxylan endo-1,4-beta-xylanase [Ruminococcus sp.]